MRDRFEAVITALWSSLGLAPPTRIDADEAFLSIDGRKVVLSLTRNGEAVLIQSVVGRLDADQHRGAGQVHDLLRTALGLMLTNRAALRLDDAADKVVMVQAVGPCQVAAVPELRNLIEDVLFQIDLHSPTLEPRRKSRAPVSEWRTETDNTYLILRA